MVKMRLLLLSLSVTVIASGCSSHSGQGNPSSSPTGDQAGNSQPAAKKDPIKLLFYTAQNGNYATDDNFQREIGHFITEKFPYISIEHIHKGKGTSYQELISSGQIPDIILESSTNVTSQIIANDLQYDMSELIKKNKMDLSRIDQTVLQVVKNWGDSKLYGLPFLGSNFVLFYGKDVFDKFGVPYPKDGITWDETYELTRRLTQVSDGVGYVGLRINSGLLFKYNQRSLGFLDTKADKAAVNNEAWQALFSQFKRYFEIPGNSSKSPGSYSNGTVAMDLNVAEKVIPWFNDNPSFNGDIVAAPVFKDAPGTGLQPNFYSLYISSQSKYKDDAFQVINYLLSDEVQTQLSRKALLTPLVDKKIQGVYGQDLAGLKGKNMQAIFYNKYASAPPARDANLTFVDVAGQPGTAFDNMLNNNLDINTALRTMEDTINKAIQDKKNAK